MSKHPYQTCLIFVKRFDMNSLLWAGQLFLAIVFLYSGVMKSTRQREKLVAIGQTGVEHLTHILIRFIGITEILGSISLILPWYLDILPLLTPLAATGFSIIMVLAGYIHYSRGEYKTILLNTALLCIAIFVAYNRFKMI